MSGGMPELGSKISLISKADIRYEGRLYTVDPQECTIALSSVRSFGTEDRETQFQIAPQSQIYDYILFRGSDIKDIRVVNNSLPHPNDPAIMQVQLPNGQNLMHFPMPNMNQPHAPPMGAGPYGNPFGMSGLGGIGGGGSGAGPSLAPGSGAPGPYMLGGGNQPPQQQQAQQPPQQQQQQQKSQQQQKQPNMLAGGSRSTTPMSLISRKSPSADMGVQVNQQQQPHHNQNNQHQGQNNAGGNGRDSGHKRQNHQRGGNRGGNYNNVNDFYQENRDRRDSGRNYNNHHDGGGRNYNNQRNHQGNGGGGGGGGGQNRGYSIMRGLMMGRGGGGGGGRGRMQNHSYGPVGGAGGNQNKPRNNKNTIKFEQDFDFEQANNKFEELRSQLSKLKVGDEPKSEQMNGETDKKDDSGNETGAGEHEPEDEEISVGYDKTKSFFDNISCEAAQDRTKNKKNDWRQERKLNSETFGVSSTRRGGYRGRGNYYNRNVGNYGGGGGGGYNRNYRGGNNNYRNRARNSTGGAANRNNGATSTTNSNGTNANNNGAVGSTNNNAAAGLKNQTPNAVGGGASGSGSGNAVNATKSATSESSNTPQQLAAVGAAQ